MRRRFLASFLVGICFFGPVGPLARAQDKVDFQRDIRPILSNNCFKCHGPDVQKAHLRLDSRERATKDEAIVPGKPEVSLLIQRVSADDKKRMPPPEAFERLKPAQVTLLKKRSEERRVGKECTSWCRSRWSPDH